MLIHITGISIHHSTKQPQNISSDHQDAKYLQIGVRCGCRLSPRPPRTSISQTSSMVCCIQLVTSYFRKFRFGIVSIFLVFPIISVSQKLQPGNVFPNGLALPLAVKNPYLNTWICGGGPNSSTVLFNPGPMMWSVSVPPVSVPSQLLTYLSVLMVVLFSLIGSAVSAFGRLLMLMGALIAATANL